MSCSSTVDIWQKLALLPYCDTCSLLADNYLQLRFKPDIRWTSNKTTEVGPKTKHRCCRKIASLNSPICTPCPMHVVGTFLPICAVDREGRPQSEVNDDEILEMGDLAR